PANDITAAGTASVTVFNPVPGGGASNSQTFTISSLLSPVVSSIAPTSGPITGGTPVTITGTGFRAGATVTIGGSPAPNVNIASATSITAVATAHAAGVVDVLVTNSDGQSGTRSGGYTYTNLVPTSSNLSPSSATVGGETFPLTVRGGNFVADSKVRR